MRIIDHLPLGIVTRNRRATQPLENADLNLLGSERQQAIEPGPEALQGFARQSDDQVGVDVNSGLGAQKPQILLQPLTILAPLDERADFLVEGLNADLELKRAG